MTSLEAKQKLTSCLPGDPLGGEILKQMVGPELALPSVDTEQQHTNCLPSHPLGGEARKQTVDPKLGFSKGPSRDRAATYELPAMSPKGRRGPKTDARPKTGIPEDG